MSSGLTRNEPTSTKAHGSLPVSPLYSQVHKSPVSGHLVHQYLFIVRTGSLLLRSSFSFSSSLKSGESGEILRTPGSLIPVTDFDVTE